MIFQWGVEGKVIVRPMTDAACARQRWSEQIQQSRADPKAADLFFNLHELTVTDRFQLRL